jgi:vesicular inhibitory amino acid transporter
VQGSALAEVESDSESYLSDLPPSRRPSIHVVSSERQSLLPTNDPEVPTKQISFGTSTYAQTIFNSVNILMGIAILSVPYAFMMVGWITGFAMLFMCSILTSYTARTLARCMDADTGMYTYGDVGEKAFGRKGKIFICAIFMTELYAACVALVVLAGDSLKALFPEHDLILLKFIIFCVVTPTTWFRSTKWLSIGSLIGVFSLFFLGFSIVVNGFIRTEQPGSITAPMETRLWPRSFPELCMSFGLLMAGFTGGSNILT